jgi:hypothetical protein
MAAPTNLETTVNSVGQREDLSDVIYRVAPEKTPLFSALGKGKAKARYHEWQTESLRAASGDNANVEGNDVGSLDAPNRTARIGNYCQLFDETGGVSGTQEAVDMAGRASEMARQKTLKGLEIRRDVEAAIIRNGASRNESGADARLTAGALAFIETNDSVGSTGASGGFSSGIVAAATNGTQRTFTEALLKTVLASRFDESGDSNDLVAFMSSAHKQTASAFTGIAEIRRDVKGKSQAVIHAAADVYVSDFGAVSMVPHAYGLTRDVLIVDPSMAEVSVLRGFETKPLAKTGDSERFQITFEAALCVKNEKAHAAIRDLT